MAPVPIAGHHLKKVKATRNNENSSRPGTPGTPTTPTDPAPGTGGAVRDITKVTPYYGHDIYKNYGMCLHGFNGSDEVWQQANQEAYFDILSDMDVSWIRAGFSRLSHLTGTDASKGSSFAMQCRERNMKWLMLPVPEGGTSPTTQTTGETTSEVNYIVENLYDICLGIEGLNEPNHNRSDTATVTTSPGWQNVAYNHQVAIWNTCRSSASRTSGSVTFTNAERSANFWVLGPSLHDTTGAQNNGQHYKDLADTGIADYMDYLGMHRYSGGGPPTNQLSKRIQLVVNAFGTSVRPFLTETGYQNAVAATGGFTPTDENAAGVYGPRAIMQIATGANVVIGGKNVPVPITRYELLDDPDPGTADVVQSHFGIVAVGSGIGARTEATAGTNPDTWRNKPEVGKVKATLAALKDPSYSGDYTPTAIPLEVVCTVTGHALQWVVTARRNGAATLFIWREKSVWDTTTLTPLTVNAVTVTVKDQAGDRTFDVDADVKIISLRVP